MLNTASCTLLADLQQGEAAVFQFWPGAHNEQVEANSFSSTGEGRVKEMGLLFPSSVSQRSSTFSWTDSLLSMGLLQLGSTQKVTLAHSQLALSFFKIQLIQTQFQNMLFLIASFKLAYLGFPWELISHVEVMSQRYCRQSFGNTTHSDEGLLLLIPGLQIQVA